MEDIIKQLLPLWGMGNRQLLQLHPSAWEVDHSYVLKVYDDKKRLERNIRLSEMLLDCAIPVAETVPKKTGEQYAEYGNTWFLMSKKLEGSSISDIKDKTIARKMGCAMAQLHRAFMKCEAEVECWDNSLLKEMKGWARETLANNGWKLLSAEEYSKTVGSLESVYDCLPKQLIHRDVHFGNFLFLDGNLSGYIDFDLSQRNIRIFDICYFLTGLLAEEADGTFPKAQWLEIAGSVLAGYESIMSLSGKEKNVIPCVMECIEILFIAYFISVNDTKRARDAYNVFRFIRNCEGDLENAICQVGRAP